MKRLGLWSVWMPLLLQHCAAQPPAWLGSYRPVSEICKGQILLVKTGTFSYADCKDAPLKVLNDGSSGFSFQVAADAKCLLPNWVMDLKPSGASVELTGYRNPADKSANIPAFTCTYDRPKTAQPQAK